MEASEVEEEIKKLGAENYVDRSDAYNDLKLWAFSNKEKAIPLLFEKSQSLDNPEVEMRIHAILREVVLYEHFGRPPGFIGIELGSKFIPMEGADLPVVIVNGVIPDSAAAKKGLKVGDVIISLEGKRMQLHALRNSGMTAAQYFIHQVGKKFKGDQLHLGLYVDGVEQEIVLTLGERPDHIPSSLPRPSKAEKDAYYENWLQQQKLKQAIEE